MNQSIKRLLTGFLAVVMILLTVVPAFAAPAWDNRIVKVGVLDFKGFSEKEENGNYFGYGIDYLNELKKYNPGWTYEFVEDDWSNLMVLLREKKIDLVCTAKYSADRDGAYHETTGRGGYAYSEQSIGQVQGTLYTTEDNNTLYYNDYEKLATTKIGFLKGSLNINMFEEFMQTYYQVDYKIADKEADSEYIKFYANETALTDALNRGEIEALATEHMAYHNDLRLIAKYGSVPFYFMSYYGNDIMPKINSTLSAIKSADYRFETDLYEKYYASSSVHKSPLFTRAEVEYLKENPEMTVGFLPDRFPMSSYDAKNDVLSGISEELGKLIFDSCGIKATMIPLDLGEKPEDALKTGKCDLVCGIIYENFEDNPEIVMTEPFMSSDLVIVSKKDYSYDPEQEQTMAVNKSFKFLFQYISEELPNMEILTTDTIEASILAVMNGDADVLMQNGYVLNYLLQNPRYDSLQVIPIDFSKDRSVIAGLSSEIDPLLLSILNKAIVVLPQQKVEDIIGSNTIGKPYTATISDVVYKYRYSITALTVLIFLGILMLIFVIIIRQKSMKILNKKNHQLADAVSQAEQANAAKSQFLARMSHEIRTPMNAIVGITAIVKTHLDQKEKTEEYLDKIDSSSKILLNIINDVLDMAAIESDKLKIAQVPFDLKTLLSGISTLYYTQCKQKGISFDMLLSDVIEEFLIGDSLRVNQILLNLLSNAYKFTPEGGSIKTLIQQMSRKGNTVFLRFTVSDTGCGISEEMQERIFSPFEQESAETAQNFGGSGLGLSITKNLVEMMHGAIRLESQKDVGTSFIVDLPFEIDTKSASYTQNNFRDIRALIVDDDANTIEYTSILLERIGVQFDLAESGEKALDIITREYEKGSGYDVCFVDWKMPGISGIELTKKIRALFDSDTIIIIVSAYDLSEIEGEAKVAGANMFISKPLFQSAVCNVLMTLSGGKYTKLTADEVEYDFSGKRVLLAEDNALNREIATELLEMVNLKVECAENGQAALEMFEASEDGHYNAILMDIQMPVMDGHEAAKEIRASAHRQAAEIPIYAMTANAFTEDVSAALSSGMNGHIAKPIDTETLYSTLRKCFQDSV